MPVPKRKQPRGIVDTSVLVAGFGGLKSRNIKPTNPSAVFLREWITRDTFLWLITGEILSEYKTVLTRRRVRSFFIGKFVNQLHERAEWVPIFDLPDISPDPADNIFCACAEYGLADFIVTLNPRDFPQHLLAAHVIAPGDPIPTTRRKSFHSP